MKNLLELSSASIYLILFTAMGIYFGIILYTKIAGKRSFSKMSSFDFAMLYILQMAIALLRQSKFIQSMVDNQPLLLMDGEKILYEN